MKKNFTPPTLAELSAYAREINFRAFDAQRFLDHYETIGWVVGKTRTPMVSWRAAVRVWQRNQAEWANQPKPGLSTDPAVQEYAAQVRRCRAAGGVDIGRLYAKVRDNLGEDGLAAVKALAQQGA